VRETGVPPWALGVDEAELADRLPEIVAAEAAATGDGKLAVLVPSRRAAELAGPILAAAGAPQPGWLGAGLRARVGGDQGQDVLSAPVAVLTVAEAKGLEFDSVVVVEPTRVAAESPQGLRALYVALTRTTRRLRIVHAEPLPEALAAA
jgi:hypothetical protein